MLNKLTVNNALLNSFVDYYHYRYLDYYLGHCVATKKDIRRINIHMKLTGKSFTQELSNFVSDFAEWDIKYDFSLDYYEDSNGIPLLNFLN